MFSSVPQISPHAPPGSGESTGQGSPMIALIWHGVVPVEKGAKYLSLMRTELNRASRTASKLLSEYERQRKRVADSMSRAVERGIPPERVAEAVLRAVESRKPQLRYRVGTDAQWLPRLRSVAPWNLYASGVRRRFAVDALD